MAKPYIFWEETHYYSLTKEQYEEFLNDYCEHCSEDVDYDSIYGAFVDWITGKGKCEIESCDNDASIDEVIQDINDRLDPHGTKARRDELQNDIELAEKRIKDSLKEIEDCKQELRELGY